MAEALRVQKLLIEQNAEIDRLKNRIEQLEAALNKCVDIVETYRIPVGNSRSGELACEWTYDALKEIRNDMKDVIRAAIEEKKDD